MRMVVKIARGRSTKKVLPTQISIPEIVDALQEPDHIGRVVAGDAQFGADDDAVTAASAWDRGAEPCSCEQ